MEECPQCGRKLKIPTIRLVQDSCGHKKCRACLLEDETACKQCKDKVTSPKQDDSVINCYTPVITYKKHDEDLENEIRKCQESSTNDNVVDSIKRSYQTLVIPTYITINSTSPFYKCELCGKTFNTKWHIKYHQYCSGGKKPFKCNTCLKEFIAKSHLESHVIIHTGSKQHVCNICRKSFAEKSKLVRHQLLHSDEKPFVCQECGKRFKSKESLKLHIRIHKGDKPFKCSNCNAKFNNSSNLKKHEVTHSKEKLHMCDQCGKRFKLKWALTVHYRVHLHLKPYKCTSCTKAFKNAKDLHRHKLIHSDVKAYSCGVCRIDFRRKDNLVRHMKNTHPGVKVPLIKNQQLKETAKPPTPQFVDNPNAIKVIMTAPEKNSKVSVINAPLKLAFKTSAFKSHYNIQRNYEPPNDDNDTESINIYQKILQPQSPKPSGDSEEQNLTKVSDDIINQYKNKPINYETSFLQYSHAIIKNIKFKLPENYTNIRSTKEFHTIEPLEPVCNTNVEEELQNNDSEYTELRPAKTSVIVNSLTDLHWRRRTLQTLNIKNNCVQKAV